MSAAAGDCLLTLEVDMRKGQRPSVESVKALRRVWDGESDLWLSPLSIKDSQGLIDVED